VDELLIVPLQNGRPRSLPPIPREQRLSQASLDDDASSVASDDSSQSCATFHIREKSYEEEEEIFFPAIQFGAMALSHQPMIMTTTTTAAAAAAAAAAAVADGSAGTASGDAGGAEVMVPLLKKSKSKVVLENPLMDELIGQSNPTPFISLEPNLCLSRLDLLPVTEWSFFHRKNRVENLGGLPGAK